MNMMVSAAALVSVSPAAATLPDPIYAMIEAHKAAKVSFQNCVSSHSKLESEIPRDLRQSNIDAYEQTIVPTDDPRWIQSERDIDRLGDVETDAACQLVNVAPTTMAGVIALLQYANAADTDGHSWPADLQDDDGKGCRSWQHFLIEKRFCGSYQLNADPGYGPGWRSHWSNRFSSICCH